MPKIHLRGAIATVLLIAVSTGVALLLAEWITRITYPQDVGSIVNIYAHDEHLQYKYQPNARTRQKSPEYDVEIVTNSMGFRDGETAATKPPHTCRVMIIGDSYSVGHGVPAESGYAALVERFLNERPTTAGGAKWEVINASVSGYHLYHYMRSIELYARPLDIDLVIVGFFIGNDFGGHDGSARRIVRNGYLGRYERGMRDLGGATPGALVRRWLTPLREWLATRSHLYVLAVKATFPLLAKAGLVSDEYTFNFRPYKRNPEPRIAKWYRETEPLIAATTAAAKKGAVSVLFVVIPDRAQVYDRLWARAIGATGLPADELAYDVPNQRIGKMLESHAFPRLDLLPIMRRDQQAQLYFPRDGHWNAAGHKVAAEAVADWIAGATADGVGGPSLRCLSASL